ncbi:restriction endonuclease subunit S [Bacteroides ovatus]|nr:restriction endonuclease subunit S [Bacteroides ovatus]KAA3819415.1 restriction endonuclease subunit S [Bacteroides ovatus]KAA3843174.1 restriction endonuclease subunit S [Bacteroides ovatus]KAA3884425.1 restriction endonuclease subunit S [Bacteroides ovatus]
MIMANNNNKDKCNVPHLRFPEFTGEWKMATFGDIAKGFDYGMNAAAKSFDGNNKYIRITDIDEVSSQYLYDDVVSPDGELEDRYLVKENDILLARTGASTGKSYLYRNSDGKLYFAGFLIRANIYKHNSYFVFSQLHTLRYKKWISVMSARSGQPGINSQEYASFPVYTTSLQEEDKIATFLKLLDERIITQNKIIEDLKKLKSAIIDYAINSLDTDFAKFGSLYETAGEGGTPTTSNASFYDNGKIPFVKIDDLKQKYLTENKDFITELGLQKSSAWLVPTRSILFSNGATIGEITITTYPVCTKQGILGIVPKSNIDVEFLYYFMSSTYFKKAISRIVTEGTMKTAYLKDIANILCPIPTKEKQQGIAKMPSALNSKIDYEQSLLKLFIMQKQYLLRQMFI